MPSHSHNPAMRAHLDTQISMLAQLTHKSYDTARRLNDLHLELARDLSNDFYITVRQMASTGDPMQLSALMARQLQPCGERWRIYAKQLGGVLGGAQLELTRATEQVMPETSRAAQAFAASAMQGAGARGLFTFPYGGNGAA